VFWLFPSPYPDVWGPFASRNHFAQFLELVLPIALWLAWRRPQRDSPRRSRPSPLYLSMSAAILAAGAASASRAGVALLTLETLVSLFLLLRRPFALLGARDAVDSLISLRRPRHSGWMWAAIPAAVIGCVLIAGGPTLLGRFLDRNPLENRAEIFQSAWELIQTRPGWGYGVGTFALVYPEFAHFDAGRFVEHAHNDWLEFAAGGGVGFALVWLIAAGAMVKAAVRSIWGVGVVAICLHALVDDPFSRLGTAGWIFALAGVLETTRLQQ